MPLIFTSGLPGDAMMLPIMSTDACESSMGSAIAGAVSHGQGAMSSPFTFKVRATSSTSEGKAHRARRSIAGAMFTPQGDARRNELDVRWQGAPQGATSSTSVCKAHRARRNELDDRWEWRNAHGAQGMHVESAKKTTSSSLRSANLSPEMAAESCGLHHRGRRAM